MPSGPSLLIPYSHFILEKEAPPPNLNETGIRLVHCALGISTEILELDQSRTRENTIEELGDTLWYLTLTACVIGQVQLTQLPLYTKLDPNQNEIQVDVLKEKAEVFLSLCKKMLIYQHNVPDQLTQAFYDLWQAFLMMCKSCNVAVEWLIDHNQQKLMKRYQAKFSSQEAEERRDKEDESNS